MRFFDRFKRSRELARLSRAAWSTPSPSAVGELAEKHIAVGQFDEALSVAERGLTMFPESERLRQVRVFTRKKQLAGRIRKLRDEIGRHPTPTSYTQLAELLRELGYDDEALETAARCAERFPESDGPHLVEGRIQFERFLQHQIARDAELAEEALRRAAERNWNNPQTHALLGELYHLVGSTAACRHHLNALVQLVPDDQATKAFLYDLDNGSGQDAEALEFGDRAREVEDSGVFTCPQESFPHSSTSLSATTHLDAERLAQDVGALTRVEGMRNVLVVDREDVVIAQHAADDGLEPSRFARLARSLSTSAREASRRMDTGELVRVEVQCPTGNVMVARAHGLIVAVQHGEGVRPSAAWSNVQDFIAAHVEQSEVANA